MLEDMAFDVEFGSLQNGLFNFDFGIEEQVEDSYTVSNLLFILISSHVDVSILF